MKIAIQGHPTRGKEVIQILESLGGTNDFLLRGVKDFWYFIDSHGHIRNEYQTVLIHTGFKTYTLEEFEKEFPFKVGDIVQTKPCGEPAKVIRLYPNPACIIAYKVRYKSGKEMQYCPENIKFYKEMKEERNITLTLEKAKEWYQKGGELREVALQAYSEEELIKVELPKTWEEFCKNYPIKAGECWIGAQCFINICKTDLNGRECRNWIPSQKSAEAHLALIQLEQLRDCYRQGDIPDFTKLNHKYCIAKINKRIDVVESSYTSYFLSFTKKEVAEKFLINFKPLIKTAEDYI